MARKTWNVTITVLIMLNALHLVFADSENNNTPATANTAAINTTISGSLGDSITPNAYDNYDWYSVVLPSDGKLQINAQTESVDLSILIYCSVSDMNVNSPSGDYTGSAGGPTADSIINFLHAGAYYFVFSRGAGKGTYSASMNFTPASLSNDVENNDTAKLAQSILQSSTTTGHLGYYSTSPGNDNYDWFKVVLPSDGTLKLTTTTSDGNLDATILIYCTVANFNMCSPSGDYTGSTGNATIDSITNYLHAQTIWILVSRGSGVGSYTLVSLFTPADLTNDNENNDTAKLSGDVSINTTATGHLGYYSTIPGTDTYDWYKIVLPSDGLFNATSITSNGNLDCTMLLYCQVANMNATNPSGDYYGSTGNVQKDSMSLQLRAQTLYLLVSRGSGVGSYTLNATFTPASMANDAEPNDNPAHAEPVPLDSVASGHLGYYNNDPGTDHHDWFSIVIPSATTLKVSLLTSGKLDCSLLFYKTVSDMNASSPSGDYYGSAGDTIRDSMSVQVQPGTYYIAVIWSSGAGSYSLATGKAIPLSTSALDNRPLIAPEIGNAERQLPTNTDLHNAFAPMHIAVYSLQGRLIFTRDIATRPADEVIAFIKNKFPAGRYLYTMECNGVRRMLPLSVVTK
jgi:hypothetical protein